VNYYDALEARRAAFAFAQAKREARTQKIANICLVFAIAFCGSIFALTTFAAFAATR
jgi:hypothetical protein